ncbi:hypothetical protein BGZ80_002488 [Entomortierella chlamydospora]|uniref:SH3 domain-containing protein n=1 Tax=Entomortierella chlamydospora TaxID=101097 RepID=A0A9P6SX36_9FUNG|nr:hypothetical protein BGZ79_002058 [Entomortierella chlamydospora]KAG0009341.1 hypothetical protein BGZ80_002488 [Entomortierella chlamydospora]
MKTYPSKTVILAVATIVALIGSASIFTAEAAPIAEDLNVNKVSFGPGLESRDVHHLAKRADPIVIGTTTATHTEKAPTKTTTVAKTTTAETATKTTTKAAATKTTTSHAATTTAAKTSSASSNKDSTSTVGTVPSSTTSGASSTASPGTGSGENVPTGVNEKVFIGLGTVGGLIVFALGGVAFCRHRRKKNLATALLQQTAQFNNNNPYAKLPEPAATPKESLPMTPTKPLGTYNVVAIYTPALADEIEIGLGDSVTILQEFDDGWCMGVNNTRNTKGVFPRHCVEMGPYEGSQLGAPGGPHYPPSPSFKAAANKRMSSIAPASGWNDSAYPPQPNPPYPGPNQGGFYN